MRFISGQSACGPRDVSLHFDPLVDCTTSEVLTLYDIAAATAQQSLLIISDFTADPVNAHLDFAVLV